MLVLVERYLSKAGIRLANEEDGQGLIEYVLIAALMSVIVLAGVVILGPQVDTAFTSLGGQLNP